MNNWLNFATAQHTCRPVKAFVYVHYAATDECDGLGYRVSSRQWSVWKGRLNDLAATERPWLGTTCVHQIDPRAIDDRRCTSSVVVKYILGSLRSTNPCTECLSICIAYWKHLIGACAVCTHHAPPSLLSQAPFRCKHCMDGPGKTVLVSSVVVLLQRMRRRRALRALLRLRANRVHAWPTSRAVLLVRRDLSDWSDVKFWEDFRYTRRCGQADYSGWFLILVAYVARACRFERSDLERLIFALGLPPYIPVDNRLRVTAQEGLAVLLRRLAYPNRLSDLESLFGRTRDQLSRINSSHLCTCGSSRWISYESLRTRSAEPGGHCPTATDSSMAHSVRLAGRRTTNDCSTTGRIALTA